MPNAQRLRKAMTDALVLADEQGRYYLVAQPPWHPVPVPPDHTAALEAALQAGDASSFLSDAGSAFAQLHLVGVVHLPPTVADVLADADDGPVVAK